MKHCPTAQVFQLMRDKQLPMVIDADGLYIVTKNLGLVKGYPHAILTPNKNEYQRLADALGVDTEQVSTCCACKLLEQRHFQTCTTAKQAPLLARTAEKFLQMKGRVACMGMARNEWGLVCLSGGAPKEDNQGTGGADSGAKGRCGWDLQWHQHVALRCCWLQATRWRPGGTLNILSDPLSTAAGLCVAKSRSHKRNVVLGKGRLMA